MKRALLCLTLLAASCSSLPIGAGGSDADLLAHKAEQWVNKDAWDKTNAVVFKFRDKRAISWDKGNGFVAVKNGDVDAQIDLWDRSGFAQKNGVELEGADKKKALDDAWGVFCNDTFWLNPVVKMFDPGTKREIVDMDGKKELKVTYGSGGVTPGDSYVWDLGADGEPKGVRMWVSVLPVKGISFTWDGWVTLATGAKVATQHGAAGMDHAVSMGDVQGTAAANDLKLDVMFARLAARRTAPPAN